MEDYWKIVLAEYSDTFNRNKKMENAKMNLKLLVLNKVGVLVTQSYLTLCDPMNRIHTVSCQVPLSVGFSRKEYWSGLPFSSPGELPDRRSNLVSCIAGRFFTI